MQKSKTKIISDLTASRTIVDGLLRSLDTNALDAEITEIGSRPSGASKLLSTISGLRKPFGKFFGRSDAKRVDGLPKPSREILVQVRAGYSRMIAGVSYGSLPLNGDVPADDKITVARFGKNKDAIILSDEGDDAVITVSA